MRAVHWHINWRIFIGDVALLTYNLMLTQKVKFLRNLPILHGVITQNFIVLHRHKTIGPYCRLISIQIFKITTKRPLTAMLQENT